MFLVATGKTDVVPVQTLAYLAGLCRRPVPFVQNLDKVAEAFPARLSTTECCPCIFPLGNVAEKKVF